MNYFKRYNNIVGWVVFAAALAIYVLTTEPAGSWWDCMEFITTSYKLEVGHPPGSPLFMMMTRLFSLLAFGHVEWVGLAANLASCTASAFCILFTFWTITHMARKMYGKSASAEPSKAQVWTAIGAGVIGAMSLTFSDTFWFSAVEGEVYALSSMFTAIVVWMMLKWEDVADEPHANRWLVLIAYMMGLSIGVHILNLLTIPALVFIYYFRKTDKVTAWGVVKATLIAGALLLTVNSIIIPYTVSIGAFVDRVFVNSLRLPPNSGMSIYALLLIALVAWSVWYTHKRGKALWNTVLLCFGVILLGYGSYASVMIRAAANPPMNSNDPSNPYSLLSLLNRDQYGNKPILYGPAYTALPVDYTYGNSYYLNEEGRYEKERVITGAEYLPEGKFLFPRLFDYASAKGYESWVDIEGREISYGGEKITVPTAGENLKYFFGYQFSYMYWRYFMWNFVGRQDDEQGLGNIVHGNWLSGIDFIDQIYLGPQKDLPYEVERNKARNTFFFLPFLLGLLGLIYQLGRDKKNFTVVAWMFVMMGVALVVYFNTTPGEPRERDYVFAGSFYAFAIWIGFGVMWVEELIAGLFKKKRCGGVASAAIATAICAAIPTLMGSVGWDDHNRSGRYMGHDLGYNFMVSTLPNSIILNYGDNDTFPLWYNQEVENLRPDVRIMNMSYLGGDWYIEEMLRRYNDSDPVPFTLPRAVYSASDRLYVHNALKEPKSIKWVMEFVKSRDPRTRLKMSEAGEYMDYIPTNQIILPVNKANAIASGIVKAEDAHLMKDSIVLTLPKSSIDKSQLMLLDLLANFDWNRPIFSTYDTCFKDLGLGNYLQRDGIAYRFVPIETKSEYPNSGRIDSDYTYNLLMNEYRYGNAKDPRVYVDYFSRIMTQTTQGRNTFARLASQLVDEGKSEQAIEVLDRAMEEIPTYQFDHSYLMTTSVIAAYYKAGATDKGDALLEDYAITLQEFVEYYIGFTGNKASQVEYELAAMMSELEGLARVAYRNKRQKQFVAIYEYLKVLYGEDGAEEVMEENETVE